MAVSRTCVFCSLAAAVTAFTAAPAASVGFDRPLKSEAIESGEQGEARRTDCIYYPRFVVTVRYFGKTDRGEVNLVPRSARFACGDEVAPVEKRLTFARYVGVKGDFILTDYSYRGKQPTQFDIFDGRTGGRLISDQMQGEWTLARFTADGFVLRYRRVFTSDCPLKYGVATQCWTGIRHATGLADAMAPDCHALYDARRKTIQFADQLDAVDRTAVKLTYNAEARYSGGRLSYTALPGTVDCRLAW